MRPVIRRIHLLFFRNNTAAQKETDHLFGDEPGRVTIY